MAVDVDTRASISISKASAVAQLPPEAPPAFVDVMPDGRFLFVDGAGIGRTSELRVVLNWFEELKGLVPVK